MEEKSAAQVEKSEDLKGEENITGLKNIEQIPDGEWQVENWRRKHRHKGYSG